MLSRTADNLYWMSRYMERAESLARILDVAHRMAQVPQGPDLQHMDDREWRAALTISGQLPGFEERGDSISSGTVIPYMALDRSNPSSIVSCLFNARENARTERGVMPTEMFECLNTTWIEVRDMTYPRLVEWGFVEFCEWVRERSHLFRGVTTGTMLRNEAYHFSRLGAFLERSDNMARLLDVKYHMLGGEDHEPDQAVDYYQWGALLRAASALKAYRQLYRSTAIHPSGVAEMLMLRADFPRSLHASYQNTYDLLEALASPGAECTRLCGEQLARFKFGRISDMTRGKGGLHKTLTQIIQRTTKLSEEIGEQFLMVPVD